MRYVTIQVDSDSLAGTERSSRRTYRNSRSAVDAIRFVSGGQRVRRAGTGYSRHTYRQLMRYVSFHVNSVISELGTGRSRRLTFRKLTRYVSFHVDSVIAELGLVETADTLSEN